MNKKILTGLTSNHIDLTLGIHIDIIPHYQNFSQLLENNGFQLKTISSFRSFDQQLIIWNQKAQGLRKILDSSGSPINFDSLTQVELLFAILRWSALPGTSRHHWGTDFDIIDQKSLPENYQVQLTPQEVGPGGPFFEMHSFIDEYIKSEESFPFFRPYEFDLGGVSPEKWHVSYRPLSDLFLKQYNFEFFSDFLDKQDPDQFKLLSIIKENKKLIYEKYIVNISP